MNLARFALIAAIPIVLGALAAATTFWFDLNVLGFGWSGVIPIGSFLVGAFAGQLAGAILVRNPSAAVGSGPAIVGALTGMLVVPSNLFALHFITSPGALSEGITDFFVRHISGSTLIVGSFDSAFVPIQNETVSTVAFLIEVLGASVGGLVGMEGRRLYLRRRGSVMCLPAEYLAAAATIGAFAGSHLARETLTTDGLTRAMRSLAQHWLELPPWASKTERNTFDDCALALLERCKTAQAASLPDSVSQSLDQLAPARHSLRKLVLNLCAVMAEASGSDAAASELQILRARLRLSPQDLREVAPRPMPAVPGSSPTDGYWGR